MGELPPSRRIRQVVIKHPSAVCRYNAPGTGEELPMNSRRVLFIAACLFLHCRRSFCRRAGSAAATTRRVAMGSATATAGRTIAATAATAIAMGASQQQPQQQQEACVQDFGKLRDTAQKRAEAIRNASARKAQAKEACGLFVAFTDAEAKMIKFVGDNTARCGIPPEIVKNLKQGHVKSVSAACPSLPSSQRAPAIGSAEPERRADGSGSQRRQHQDRHAAPAPMTP